MRGEPKRSSKPQDLRNAGPSGPVSTYWEPDAFNWYGNETQGRGSSRDLFVRISENQIRISNAAAIIAGINTGDKVQIGVNKGFLAFRKDAEGFRVRSDGVKTTRAVYLAAAKVIDQIKEYGYPVPSRIHCVWDEKSGMLVARKPC